MQTERHVKQRKNCCALLFIQIRYFPIFFHSVSAFFIEQSQLLTHKAIFVNNADVSACKKLRTLEWCLQLYQLKNSQHLHSAIRRDNAKTRKRTKGENNYLAYKAKNERNRRGCDIVE